MAEGYDNFISGAQMEDPGKTQYENRPVYGNTNQGSITHVKKLSPEYAEIKHEEHQIPANKIMNLFDEKIRENIKNRGLKLIRTLTPTLQSFRKKFENKFEEQNKAESKTILTQLLKYLQDNSDVLKEEELINLKSQSAKIIDDYFKPGTKISDWEELRIVKQTEV